MIMPSYSVLKTNYLVRKIFVAFKIKKKYDLYIFLEECRDIKCVVVHHLTIVAIGHGLMKKFLPMVIGCVLLP